MVDYVKEAGAQIRVELSKIIKSSDFVSSTVSPSLGHLHLLPKVQKLTQVDHSQVDCLRCRGIKSSLQDLIKIIQKALDSIFGHLLYFIEEEFISKYGRLSPSCSRSSHCRNYDENSIFNARISIHISKFTTYYSFPTLFASFAVQNACTTSNVFAYGDSVLKGHWTHICLKCILSWFQCPFFTSN